MADTPEASDPYAGEADRLTIGDDGWQSFGMRDPERFISLLGRVETKLVGEVAHVRMFPERRHSNMRQGVHGGATAGFIDLALFAASRVMGLTKSGTAVTLDLSIQYMGEGRIGEPLEARVELLKETGRMLFLRGIIVQAGDHRVAAFSGTIRKPAKQLPAGEARPGGAESAGASPSGPASTGPVSTGPVPTA